MPTTPRTGKYLENDDVSLSVVRMNTLKPREGVTGPKVTQLVSDRAYYGTQISSFTISGQFYYIWLLLYLSLLEDIPHILLLLCFHIQLGCGHHKSSP